MKSLKRLFSNDTHGAWSRRKFIGASILAGLASACGVKTADLVNGATSDEIAEKLAGENIYTKLLGVEPHLPTHDHITRFGGSRMPEEVLQAMAEANDYFVDMDELTIAAGKRVAEVVHAEAALITSGAFGGLVLGSAACLTGTDTDKMKALPHPSWSKKECLIQTPHRFFYDRAYRAAGMTIVEVETREQFVNAINENTAMTACLAMAEHAHAGDPTVMMPEEHVEIGRKTGVPVMIDAASELPPTENLTRYTEMGGDLVIISGGKGLRGPQSTGILAGRADLIEAARLQAAPNAHLGRGMKVGKEEIIGLIAALNRYGNLDHDAVQQEWLARAEYVAGQLQDIPGLQATTGINARGIPHVALEWDEKVIPMSREEMRARLKEGKPRLALSGLNDGNKVVTRCMRDGEDVLAAKQLRQFFLNETAKKA